MKKQITVVTVIMLVLTLSMFTACAKAEFELSSLEIIPSNVTIGDTAIVSVDVANVGNAEGTYSVTLSLDSIVLETIDVTIPADSTREVKFEISKGEIGVYTIEIGDLRGQLQVVEPAAIELVPQHVNIIGNIQVSRIVNDPDLTEAYNKAEEESEQPQTFEEALTAAIEETGIDFRNFSEAIVYGDLTEFEQQEYLGFIVEGSFNQQQFINNFKEKANREFATSDYKGYKLYIDEEDEFGIAFLSDKMLLLGSTKAVEDAIDVRKGDRKQVGGSILDTYNQLGDVLIKFSFKFPEEARKALLEESSPEEIPISLEPFADIDILGLALNKEGETISVYINSHFLSTDSTEDVYDTLLGAKLLFKGMIPDPEIKGLLDKISVNSTGSSVTIAFEMTLSEIEQLQETFGQ